MSTILHLRNRTTTSETDDCPTAPAADVTATARTAGDDRHVPDRQTALRLLVVSAASPSGRAGGPLTAWILDQLDDRHDIEVGTMPVAEALADPDAWADAVAGAGAVLLVTPEHNHSFPAELKGAIDALHAEWTATPVGIVSYGSGFGGGLRAVEQLRQVFAELHTLVVRDTVALPLATSAFDDEGRPRDADGMAFALDRLVTSLRWWARTLAEGVAREPYPR